MSLFRRINTPFASDYFIFDDRLSAESLGVLCYLMSRPLDWIGEPRDLEQRFGCGRDRMHRIINELVDVGYLEKVRGRDPISQTWMQVEYLVNSAPISRGEFA